MLTDQSLGYLKYALGWCLLVSVLPAISAIIQCKDESGQLIYTDKAFNCAKNTPPAVIVANKKQQINYRFPARNYSQLPGEWHIWYESNMSILDQELFVSASEKLLTALHRIADQLPKPAVKRLKALKFYLMWGERSPQGGEKSGMRFVRTGEPSRYPHYDPSWEHAIIIYSATNLMYLSDLWTQKALTHEMAHAWHISNWPEKHPAIIKPWQQAKAQGLYRQIKDNKGQTIGQAYALTNQLEYFAELSAIYFVGGNYHPFDRTGLSAYDPQGLDMVEKIWQTQGPKQN